MSSPAVERTLSTKVIASDQKISHLNSNNHKPWHRSWFRLMPYTAFGALLISLQSAENLNSIVKLYSFLIIAQLGVAAIYFLTAKLSGKKS